jgi:hypothetical protein
MSTAALFVGSQPFGRAATWSEIPVSHRKYQVAAHGDVDGFADIEARGPAARFIRRVAIAAVENVEAVSALRLGLRMPRNAGEQGTQRRKSNTASFHEMTSAAEKNTLQILVIDAQCRITQPQPHGARCVPDSREKILPLSF